MTERTTALVVERPPALDAALVAALRDDLVEMLQFMRLRVLHFKGEIPPHEGPMLAVFTDIPAVPPECLEGAAEELEEYDVAIGPCADGSLYLLGFGAGLDSALEAELLAAATGPDGLSALAPLLEAADLATVLLPPWFRVAKSGDVSFAESLIRLSLLDEEGDDRFMADRLRLRLEKKA
jgi:hypothetical protein